MILPTADVLVLLTDRDSRDLGEGVTARLTGQKVFALDRWQQLTSLFRARQIDPALVAEEWAVDALLAEVPATGYRPVGGGYLDRETALAALADTQAGLSGLDLDLTGLLRWSLDAAHLDRWKALAPGVRDGLSRWLTERGDRSESVAAVLRCFAGPAGEDAVALGLVLGALSHPEVADAAQVPRTILETRAVGGALRPDAAAEWGRAADGLDAAPADAGDTAGGGAKANGHGCCDVPRSCLARSTPLLSLTRARYWSRRWASKSGGSASRWARFSAHASPPLRTWLRWSRELSGCRLTFLPHITEERVRRAEMAVRLVRWLTSERTAAVTARAQPRRGRAAAAVH